MQVSRYFLLYPGKMSYDATDDPDNPEEVFEGMACGEIFVLGDFNLTSDDPLNYTDKVPIIQQTRYFPDQQYPSGADPDPLLLPDTPSGQESAAAVGSEPVASTSAGASSSIGPLPALPAVDTAMKDLQEQLISHHASIVKMCQKVGIKDVCSINQKSKVDALIQSLDPKDLSCKVCKKKLSSKQHLKDHLKSKHFGKTDYYCSQCKKYFCRFIQFSSAQQEP